VVVSELLHQEQVQEEQVETEEAVLMDLHTALTAKLPGQMQESMLTNEFIRVSTEEAQRLLSELLLGSAGDAAGQGTAADAQRAERPKLELRLLLAKVQA
jgi:hypothetical protein